MDILYCKAQLAWVVQNAKDAQEHLDDGDSNSALYDLDMAERAIQRIREEMRKLK